MPSRYRNGSMPYTPRPLKRRKWGRLERTGWKGGIKGGIKKKLEKNGMRCKKKKTGLVAGAIISLADASYPARNKNTLLAPLNVTCTNNVV